MESPPTGGSSAPEQPFGRTNGAGGSPLFIAPPSRGARSFEIRLHSAGPDPLADELDHVEKPAFELIKQMLAEREAGASAKVVEGVAEPAALPAPRKPRRKTRKGDKEDVVS